MYDYRLLLLLLLLLMCARVVVGQPRASTLPLALFFRSWWNQWESEPVLLRGCFFRYKFRSRWYRRSHRQQGHVDRNLLRMTS